MRRRRSAASECLDGRPGSPLFGSLGECAHGGVAAGEISEVRDGVRHDVVRVHNRGARTGGVVRGHDRRLGEDDAAVQVFAGIQSRVSKDESPTGFPAPRSRMADVRPGVQLLHEGPGRAIRVRISGECLAADVPADLVGVAMVGKADQLDEHDVAGNGTILRCGHRGAFAHGGQEHSVQVETTLTITSMSEYPVATKVSASSGTGGISTSTVWPQEWQVAWACACSLNPKAAP